MIEISQYKRGRMLSKLYFPETSSKIRIWAVNYVDVDYALNISNGLATLQYPIMIPVYAGETVSILEIRSNGSLLASFILEGDEVYHFDNNGTYVINSLQIRVVGE